MDEPPIAYAMLGLMSFLEILLIRFFIAKVKAEKCFAESSEKMSAMVRSAVQGQSITRTPVYIFTVDAINGRSYTLSGSGIKASKIKAGDIVEIYVPEGFELMDEDAYFESIISGGSEAVNALSDGEKERLLEYIRKRTESIYGRVKMIGDGEVPSLTFEGKGMKKELIPSGILILVMAFFILMFGYELITGRF